MEKEHHLYGGSTAKYWSNCYGWASLMKDVKETPGPAAIRGTALHKGVLEVKAAQEIKHLQDGSPKVISYEGIPEWPDEGPLLADQFWELVWTNVLEGFITGKQIYIERKLMLFAELDCGGTADLIVLYYNDKGQLVAVLGDAKFGRVRVGPDEEQLKFYLAALYKKVLEKGKTIDVFKSFVYQPEHSEPYTEHTFTKSEIEKAIAKYEKAITESKKEKPKFKVGDWCKWCQASPRCAAYTKHLDEQMEMTVVRNRDIGTVEFVPVETLSDDILRNVFLYGDKLKSYISACNKEVIRRFASQQPVEGLKVVDGVSKRKFTNETVAAEQLRTYGIEPMKQKLMGIGDITKALQHKGYKKKEADELIAPLVSKPPAPPLVTTIDDPRPAIVLKDAASLLEEFDDSEV